MVPKSTSYIVHFTLNLRNGISMSKIYFKTIVNASVQILISSIAKVGDHAYMNHQAKLCPTIQHQVYDIGEVK